MESPVAKLPVPPQPGKGTQRNEGIPKPIDRALRVLIVTPALHKVHHSVVREECDSNFSSLFSWWDRLFRTLRISRDPRKIRFGVDS